jgi:hypothetical protein
VDIAVRVCLGQTSQRTQDGASLAQRVFWASRALKTAMVFRCRGCSTVQDRALQGVVSMISVNDG